ncbi:TIGR00341 family protein [archaeon SCG-AAA382B04]|nr:TIGR00341 family protein [archaeon SCG-AAA382B04]
MSFRNIQIAVPKELKEEVKEIIKKQELDYFVSSSEEDKALFNLNVPKEKVEELTEDLQEIGVGEKGNITVTATEAVISEKAEEIKEEVDEEESDRISREEIVSKTTEMAQLSTNYLLFTIISSVIATSGILADSTAVVVGSMVIAPLIGPAVASSAGTVLADTELFQKGMFSEIVGLLISVLSSTIFAWLVFNLNLVPPLQEPLLINEIAERIYPDFLSIGIAIGSGVAGALSLTTGLSTALVGVMIAVALIPPASVAGVGIALGNSTIAIGSTVLLMVNVISVNIAGTLTLNYQGYSPKSYFREIKSRKKIIKRVGMYVSLLLILSVFLGAITYNSYSGSQFQREVESITEQTLENMDGLSVKSISVDFTNSFLMLKSPDRVIVSIYAENAPPNNLASVLSENIQQKTGEEVMVLVEVNQIQR